MVAETGCARAHRRGDPPRRSRRGSIEVIEARKRPAGRGSPRTRAVGDRPRRGRRDPSPSSSAPPAPPACPRRRGTIGACSAGPWPRSSRTRAALAARLRPAAVRRRSRCCSTWWRAGRRSSRRFHASRTDGLEAMLTEGVTCVSATPTYWRFLLAEARSRRGALPPLEQITLGGEASPADLLDELRRTFPGPGSPRSTHRPSSAPSPRCTTAGRASRSLAVQRVQPDSNVRARTASCGCAPRPACSATPTMPRRADGDRPEATAWRPPATWSRSSATASCSGAGSPRSSTSAASRSTRCPSRSGSSRWSRRAARVFGRPNKLTGAIVAAEIVPGGGVEARTPTGSARGQGGRGRSAAGLASAQRHVRRRHRDPRRQDRPGDGA